MSWFKINGFVDLTDKIMKHAHGTEHRNDTELLNSSYNSTSHKILTKYHTRRNVHVSLTYVQSHF